MSKKEKLGKNGEILRTQETPNPFLLSLMVSYWKLRYPPHEIMNVLSRWSVSAVNAAIKRHLEEMDQEKKNFKPTFKNTSKKGSPKKLKRNKHKNTQRELRTLTIKPGGVITIELKDTPNEIGIFFGHHGLRNKFVFEGYAKWLEDKVNALSQHTDPDHYVSNFRLHNGIVSFQFHERAKETDTQPTEKLATKTKKSIPKKTKKPHRKK
jgi:hypothetical protein